MIYVKIKELCTCAVASCVSSVVFLRKTSGVRYQCKSVASGLKIFYLLQQFR